MKYITMENVEDTWHKSRQDVICFEPGVASRDGGHIYMNVAGTLRSNPGDNRLTIVCIEENGSNPSHRSDL